MDSDEVRICEEALNDYNDGERIVHKLRTGEELSFEELETLDMALSEYLLDVRDLQSRVRLRMSDF